MIPRRLLSIRIPFPVSSISEGQHALRSEPNVWDFCPEHGTTSPMVGRDTPAGSGGAMPAIRLAIVDDHEVFRMGLRSLLDRDGGIEVVWDIGSAHEALSRIVEQPVDAVLVDVNLGGPVDGLEVARMLTARDADLR